MDAKNNPEDRGWVQGVAYATANLYMMHGAAVEAADILAESGITMADLRAAKVDSFDMKYIRKLIKNERRLEHLRSPKTTRGDSHE